MVENGSSKNGLDSDETGWHPSSVNQNWWLSLASAGDKSNVMDSIGVDHSDILVA